MQTKINNNQQTPNSLFLNSDVEPKTEDLALIETETDEDLLTANMESNVPVADSIRLYLKEIGAIPLLTFDQEISLSQKIQDGLAARALLANNQEELREQTFDLKGDYQFLFQKITALLRQQEQPLFIHALLEEIKTRISRGKITNLSAHKKLQTLKENFLATLPLIIQKGENARNALANANLRLVVNIAKKYLNRGMELMDLIQWGNIGLMKASDKFDHSKGYKFSTYATWWIRQSITRALADHGRTIRLPVHMIESIHKYRHTLYQLQQKLNREPTWEELAQALSISGSQLREIINATKETISLDTPVGDEEDATLSDFIEDKSSNNPENELIQKMLHEKIQYILETLTPREKSVIEMRFGMLDGEPKTLEEVGVYYNITRERARQIELKALSKLRHPSRSRHLRGFVD